MSDTFFIRVHSYRFLFSRRFPLLPPPHLLFYFSEMPSPLASLFFLLFTLTSLLFNMDSVILN